MAQHVKNLLNQKIDEFLEIYNNEEGSRPIDDISSTSTGKTVPTPSHHDPKQELICDISRLILMEEQDYKEPEQVKKALQQKAANPLEDDRAEILNVLTVIRQYTQTEEQEAEKTTKALANHTKSVVLVVKKKEIIEVSTNTYKLGSEDLKKRKAVVAGKILPFKQDLKLSTQRSATALGTGFIFRNTEQWGIEKYYVVTAAHVIHPAFEDLALENIRFVSNYAVRAEKFDDLDPHTFNNGISFPKTSVFKPKKQKLILNKNFFLSSFSEDYAIIEIEREEGEDGEAREDMPKGIGIIPDDIFEGTLHHKHVYGLGHGLGLPMKLSPCGELLDLGQFNDESSKTFDCKIDFFSGNSGSPVFETNTDKLVGLLIRGKKDLFLSEDKESVIPGVLSTNRSGEVCQKVGFLKNYRAPQLEKPTKKLSQAELIPYTYLERTKEGIFQLHICIHTPDRQVTFSNYPVKKGAITVIECVLDAKEKNAKTTGTFSKTYVIQGPLDKLAETAESIEVSVYDRISQAEHHSVLEYINSKEIDSAELGKKPIADKVYWASCLPLSYYEEISSDEVAISIGYFDAENTFIRSNLTSFEIEELTNVWLKFKGEGENLKRLESIDKEDKNVKVLYFTTLDGNGDIKKGPALGGRNPKPITLI